MSKENSKAIERQAAEDLYSVKTAQKEQADKVIKMQFLWHRA